MEGREEKGGEGRRGEGEGRGEEAFLVMWPRRFSALNPPLRNSKQIGHGDQTRYEEKFHTIDREC